MANGCLGSSHEPGSDDLRLVGQSLMDPPPPSETPIYDQLASELGDPFAEDDGEDEEE
jgi:hypothetical protein